MKPISFSGTVVATLLVILPGCTDEVDPVGPTISPPQEEAPPAPPFHGFEALSRPGDPYEEVGDIYGTSPWHGGFNKTRYVLYHDGSFSLQSSSPRFGVVELLGSYFATDSVITFEFDAWARAGPWEATGTIDGNSITVTYNAVMMLSGFMDGVYVRGSEE